MSFFASLVKKQVLLLAVILSAVPSSRSLVAPWSASSRQVPKDCTVLILPGFGNASEDYTMEKSLVPSLQKRGWTDIRVLPVKRQDWLQVFLKGALDINFWLARASPTRPAFEWYLSRVVQKIQACHKQDQRVLVIGHSAGGWLARAAIGFGSEQESSNTLADATPIDLDKILGIVTLGAPNLPPPSGVMDMTRGALRITNEQFPGCYHAPSTFYVSVIGNAVRGKEQERSSPLEPTTTEGFAFESYQAVCGDGTTVGDGVVPQCAAHLDDAIQLDLNGVFHSINRPDEWYGSDAVLDQWHDAVLDEITEKKKQGGVEIPNLLERFSPAQQSQ